MTLINRYILSAFWRIFLLALGGFVGIYLLVDFFEKVDDFIEHQAELLLYLLYFLNNIPLVVYQVAPLAVLMGVFMTLGGLSRTNELTAMRSSGVSLWRITMPLLGMGLAISVLILAAGEFLIPLTAKKSNHIMRTEVKGKPPLTMKRDRLWLREGDTIINIRLAAPEKQTLYGLTLFRIDENFRLASRVDAARAVFTGELWKLEDFTYRSFDPDTRQLTASRTDDVREVDLKRTPADFRVLEHNNEEMSIGQLHNLAEKLQQEGFDATRYRVDLQARLATPFASLIMAFLGIPFALRKGRGTSLAVGITVSIAIGIAYHILQAMLTAFGYSGVIPPVIAAWSANLLFFLLGVWLLLTVRE